MGTAFATAHPERFRVALQRGDDVVLERVGNLRSPLEQTKGAESVAIAALPAGCTAQALAPGGTVSVPGDLGQGGGWVSGAPQLGGETITIECQQPIDAAGFRFGLGGRFAAYPRGLKIERRRDEGEWEPILIEEDAIDLERLVLHPLDDPDALRELRVGERLWVDGQVIGLRDATHIAIFDRGERPRTDLRGAAVLHTAPNVRVLPDGSPQRRR